MTALRDGGAAQGTRSPAQIVLPAWVRARGLSIFMIVFNGTMALGSAVWGVVVSHVDIPATLVAAGAGLFVFDLCTLRWRIPGDEALGE